MTSRRTLVAALLTLALTALLSTAFAGTAGAHGAPTSPVSRSAECGGEGTKTGSAACKAALAASPDLPEQWDNLRVAGVNGQDREIIPDGRLCSAGKLAFAGLDLPRDDWPTTTLKSGANFTFTYRGTIPHTGSFRLYVTKPGYDPGKQLTWSELEPKPFADVTDPPFADGSYSFAAKLPSGLTGRHLIYTIWQNSSSSDTYYSCSDVVFGAGAAAPAPAAPAAPAAPQAAAPGSAASAPAPVEPPTTVQIKPAAATQPSDGMPMPLILAAVAVIAVGGALGALLVARRRRG